MKKFPSIAEKVAFCYHFAMPLPVKLSDALVLDARLAAEVEQRSIAGQVEYWASLGKLVDALLDGRNRTEALQKSKAKPLSELVASIGTPEGDARLKAYLDSEPFPHFEPHPTRKGVLIRTEADGTRSVGRFVDRAFVVEFQIDKIAPPLEAEEDLIEVFRAAKIAPADLKRRRNPVSPIEVVKRLMASTSAIDVKKARRNSHAASGASPQQLPHKNHRAAGIKAK